MGKWGFDSLTVELLLCLVLQHDICMVYVVFIKKVGAMKSGHHLIINYIKMKKGSIIMVK